MREIRAHTRSRRHDGARTARGEQFDAIERQVDCAGGRSMTVARFSVLAGMGLLLLVLAAGMARGADADKAAPAVDTAPGRGNIESATVTIDGRDIFSVRGVAAYPAARRADEIASRIVAFAADPAKDPAMLRVVDTGEFTTIVAGETRILALTDADARLESVRRTVLAEAYVRLVREAVQSYRVERSRDYLLRSTGYAIGCLLITVLLILGLRRAFARMNAVVEQRYAGRIGNLQVLSVQLVQAEQVRATVRRLVRGLYWFAMLVVAFVGVTAILGLYPWTRVVEVWITDLVLGPLRSLGSGVLAAIPNLVFLAILVLIVRYLLGILQLFFSGIERGAIKLPDFEPEWAQPTYRLTRLGVIAFTAIVAYPYIPGASTDAFKGISIFLGVLVSLGGAAIVGNVLAGYTMIYRRAFKLGDRIRLGEVTGDVIAMRPLVTHVRSLKNEEIVIPNSSVLSSHVINYSSLARDRGLILHTTAGIGYETPWRQVEAMLLEAAARTAGVLKDPPPFVMIPQMALGDFCVTYELNVHVSDAHAAQRTYSELHRHVLDVFNEYGVQIMTPAYEGDPPDPKVVPRDQWYAAPAKPPRT